MSHAEQRAAESETRAFSRPTSREEAKARLDRGSVFAFVGSIGCEREARQGKKRSVSRLLVRARSALLLQLQGPTAHMKPLLLRFQPGYKGHLRKTQLSETGRTLIRSFADAGPASEASLA